MHAARVPIVPILQEDTGKGGMREGELDKAGKRQGVRGTGGHTGSRCGAAHLDNLDHFDQTQLHAFDQQSEHVNIPVAGPSTLGQLRQCFAR